MPAVAGIFLLAANYCDQTVVPIGGVGGVIPGSGRG